MKFSRVISHRMDFGDEYPYGAVVEELECGHTRIEVIEYYEAHPTRQSARDEARDAVNSPRQKHFHHATRRRCLACEEHARDRRRR